MKIKEELKIGNVARCKNQEEAMRLFKTMNWIWSWDVAPRMIV